MYGEITCLRFYGELDSENFFIIQDTFFFTGFMPSRLIWTVFLKKVNTRYFCSLFPWIFSGDLIWGSFFLKQTINMRHILIVKIWPWPLIMSTLDILVTSDLKRKRRKKLCLYSTLIIFTYRWEIKFLGLNLILPISYSWT